MYMREGIEAVTFQMQEPLCVVSPLQQVPPVSHGSQLRSGIPLSVAVVVLGGTGMDEIRPNAGLSASNLMTHHYSRPGLLSCLADCVM